MSTADDLRFLRECCKACVDGLPAGTNPAVVNAAQILEQRVSAIERTLAAADARTDDAGPRLRAAATKQVRDLAYTIGGFVPAVRLDAAQRRRVALLVEAGGVS